MIRTTMKIRAQSGEGQNNQKYFHIVTRLFFDHKARTDRARIQSAMTNNPSHKYKASTFSHIHTVSEPPCVASVLSIPFLLFPSLSLFLLLFENHTHHIHKEVDTVEIQSHLLIDRVILSV